MIRFIIISVKEEEEKGEKNVMIKNYIHKNEKEIVR